MRFVLDVSANNNTYKANDALVVKFSDAFKLIGSIESITFDFTPPDTASNGHDVSIRWSYDGMVWSAWEDWITQTAQSPNQQDLINQIITNRDSFYLEFRLVRYGTDVGTRTLTLATMEFGSKAAPEQMVESPFGNTSCYAQCSPSQNFYTGVKIDADPRLLFQPYNLMNPAINFYREAACAVSEMFGHCVRYFKTQADVSSADAVLKEYSLFNVTDVKDIKIMVPDNTFPDNAIAFFPYDMDFGEGLEIHIVRDHFERAFGVDDLPEQKDYLYFPLIDRMFEVHSAYLYRDFMMSQVYYKVMLYKWQDKLNVMRDIKEINDYVDNLTENFDEVLQPEVNKEFLQITKPDQYASSSMNNVGGFDNVRYLVNKDLVIKAYDLNNYFTVVGKYFYELNNGIKQNDLAVKYKLVVNRPQSEHTAFSAWFKPLKSNWTTQSNTYDTLINGYNTSESKGYQINLLYSNVNNLVVTSGIEVKINGQTLQFNQDFPKLNRDEWYAIVFNQLNDFSQASIHIWKMKWTVAAPTAQKTTDLQLLYTQNVPMVAEEVKPTTTNFTLIGGTIGITNIRIWKESIEEEKQPIILNQYVVRDSHLSLAIDNAIIPLRLVKEYVR